MLYQQVLDLRRKVLGESHPDVVISLNNLGLLYKVQGQTDAAELLYLKALAIAEQHLGTEHPNTVMVRKN